MPPNPAPMTNTSNGACFKNAPQLVLEAAADGQHALHGALRPGRDLGRHLDGGAQRLQALQYLWQGDALHVGAKVAGSDELDVREFDSDIVAHGAFGDQHHLARAFIGYVPDHAGGRADVVGLPQHFGRAFGMGHDVDAGLRAPVLPDLLRA